ncbi:hypothetical protein [Aeromicrobium sp. PE09-221]|uniref:hypothetical protein n=1 Tax=Aeromicrobium sp. PE09-221 TaxID=1898043 RepID=UPI001F171397|nr:hypothetical protein [Aeromicrobium sp. PE09-221]
MKDMSFATPLPGPGADPLVVDCDSCVVRSPGACGDCVVSVLLGPPQDVVALDDAERSALGALADSGLVPPLRLMTLDDPPTHRDAS